MTPFLQAVAGVFIAVILGLALSKQGKDITLLLCVCGCCMVLIVAGRYLEPVMELIGRLQKLSGLDVGLLSVVLKAVGIGLIAEVASLICGDSGNAALGKGLQILASAVVLWLSVPLINMLMDMIQKIVGVV